MKNEPIQMAVREGDLIAGKYRVENVIGAGGMGIVIAARHEQLGQRVAIKLVRDPALYNDEAVQRFLREGRAAARLKSEHAARVLDVGTLESGMPYMVMEFLDGSDLGQVLAQRGPLPVELAADWIAQACEAIAEAHAAGIVHRDLKPENLFLARSVGALSKVKVLDFGISKSMETVDGGALTRTRSMMGSPLYMAPEQMRSSRDVDARADVWALGVVLFELLTQRWPFQADTLPALCLKVVSDPPQSVSEFRSDVPAGLVEVIDRCLEKDPSRRFGNASELATALEPFLPAGARLTVERAGLALASGIPSAAPPLRRSPSRLPTMQGASPGATPQPTPASWGSRRGQSLVTRRTVGRLLWVSASVLGAAGLAAAVFILRGRSGNTPLPERTTPLVSPGASWSAPASQIVPASAIAVSVPQPPPSHEPDPSAVASTQPSESPPPRLSASRSAAPVDKPAAPKAPAERASSARKEPAPDDDIPTLR